MPDVVIRSGERAAWTGIVGNALLAGLKISVGVLGQSVALVADGIHSGADVVASVAVLVGLRISKLPPDAQHNYGHHKAESVAQKVVAVLLMLAGLEVVASAIGALQKGPGPRPALVALGVAGVVSIAKLGLWLYQRALAHRLRSRSLMASATDNLADLISSVVAAIGILGTRMGFVHFDSEAALLVGVLVVWVGIRLFSQAASDLMDRAVDPQTAETFRTQVLEVPGVLDVKDIRTRISGPVAMVDVKIVAARHLTLVEAHALAHRVKDTLMASGEVADVMVHVNPAQPDTPSASSARQDH